MFPQLRETQIKPPTRGLNAHNRDGAHGSSQRSAILFGDRRGTARCRCSDRCHEYLRHSMPQIYILGVRRLEYQTSTHTEWMPPWF